MHPRHPVPDSLLRAAHYQAGVVSRLQALDSGLSSRMLERLIPQEWDTLLPGVYLTHQQPPSWQARAWAGFLYLGEESALAGQAALHVVGVTKDAPDIIELCYPQQRKHQPREGWQFTRTRHMPPRIDDLSRIRPEYAVLEVCQRDRDQMVTLIAQALTSGKVTEAGLRRALSEMPRVKHRRLIEDLLGMAVAGVHSSLELRYATDVEKAHGLPTGKRQVRSGRYRCDVAYEWGLIVELEGG